MLIPNQTNRLSRRNDTSGFLPLMVIVVIVLPVWKWFGVFAKMLSDLQRTDVAVGKRIFPCCPDDDEINRDGLEVHFTRTFLLRIRKQNGLELPI